MKQHYQGLGHIAVYTADMDASIAFYEKIGGRLHLRAPACPPEQQRELALVEFGGFLVELIAVPGIHFKHLFKSASSHSARRFTDLQRFLGFRKCSSAMEALLQRLPNPDKCHLARHPGAVRGHRHRIQPHGGFHDRAVSCCPAIYSRRF